jgi:hypothetical protein
MTDTETTTTTEPWYADGLRFTCTQCGNCCTGPSGYVWFNDEELTAMADHLGLSEEAFLRQYSRKLGSRRSLTERKTKHGYDCVFLRRDEKGRALCSVYPVRPVQCRTWPFWPENLRSPRNYLEAAKGCPGTKRGLEGEGTFYPLEEIRISAAKTP